MALDWEAQQAEAEAWREKAEAVAKEMLEQNPKTKLSEYRKRVEEVGLDFERSATWWGERLLRVKEDMGIIARRANATTKTRNDSGKNHLLVHMEHMREVADAAMSVPVDPVVAAMDGAVNLAVSVLKLAYEDASAGSLSNAQTPLRVRYARAWLQDPNATALWCGLAGVDGDIVAERSRQEHGRPRITPEEIEYIRERL